MEILRNNSDSPGYLYSRDNGADASTEGKNSRYLHSKISPRPTALKITKIAPAVKNENRANIFINDEYSFSLDLAQLVDFKLKVGQTLTSAELTEYKNASEFGKLYQSALEWVLSRPHSVKETRDYLKRKQMRRSMDAKRYQNSQAYLHSAEFLNLDKDHRQSIRKSQPPKPAPEIDITTIEKIVAKLIEKGYVDDQRFAEYYIEYRHAKKGASMKKLRLELAKKGIDTTTIDQALAKIPRNDTTEIQKIIAKKRRRYSDPDKLIQYLLRQGFPYELAKTAVLETDLQSSE